MAVLRPVYIIQLIGDDVTHTFSSGGINKIHSLSVKPGMTTTIGSFELTVPDITGSLTVPGAFKDIKPFDDIKIWYGYEGQVSTHDNPDFAGKIETIVSNLDSNEGYTRTFIGSDYAECFTRVLVNRGFNNVSGDTIIQTLRNYCVGDTVGGLSSSNDYLASDTDLYTLVYNNEPVMNAIQEYDDKGAIDSLVTWNKYLRTFNRQENTGSETFVLGTNILKYSVTQELKEIKNYVHVFGKRDSSSVGSDIPPDHDYFTEESTDGWTGGIKSGSGYASIPPNINNTAGTIASGSSNISVLGPMGTENCTTWATLELEDTVRLNKGDFVHFYCYPHFSLDESGNDKKLSGSIILYSTDDDFFVCQLEGRDRVWTLLSPLQPLSSEWTIEVGPNCEGISITGSYGTNTGSYKWERVGSPDWLNINKVGFTQGIKTFDISGLDTPNATMLIDGFYFGTKYQSFKYDVDSLEDYGFRPHIITSDSYNSKLYCESIANDIIESYKDPITQVTLTTTGSKTLSLGHMYPIVLAADNINEYMQLIDLEHKLDGTGGFETECFFSNKKHVRSVIPIIQVSCGFVTPYENALWTIVKDSNLTPTKRWLPF